MQVFDINPLRAWGAVLTSIVSMSASLYLIPITPWYLLPFAWFVAGTAFTGVSIWSGRMHQPNQRVEWHACLDLGEQWAVT